MKKDKPIYWKSKNGKTFAYNEYANIDEQKKGLNPLPKEGYPYTIIYENDNDKYILNFIEGSLKEYSKNCNTFNPLEENFINITSKLTEIEKFRFYKSLANWLIGPIRAYMNEHALEEIPFIENWKFMELICIVEFPEYYGEIITFNAAAKKILPEIIKTKETAFEVICRLELIQSNNEFEILTIVKNILEKNQNKVAEYKSGKKNVANMFIGDVMRASAGKKLNPKIVAEIIKVELDR